MAKREKILVGLMIAALLYGGFELLFSGLDPERPESGLDSAQQTARQVSEQIQQAELEPARARIIELAGQQWENDPFYQMPENQYPVNTGPQENPDTEGFRYSGYLKAGNFEMAIINGVEYAPGEKIETRGAVVDRISPEKVVLWFPDTGEQATVFYRDSQGNR